MLPNDLPTGTIGSDAANTAHPPSDVPDAASDDSPDGRPDPRTRAALRERVAELERENATLRTHLDEQRRARQELIDRYERLLVEVRDRTEHRDDERPSDGILIRTARHLGLR